MRLSDVWIYTGLHQTPEQIVETVIREDADAVGLSILSGAHMTLVPRVVELLRAQGVDDVVVAVGGTIPTDDIPALKELGVAGVFTPGTPTLAIVDVINGAVSLRDELGLPPTVSDSPPRVGGREAARDLASIRRARDLIGGVPQRAREPSRGASMGRMSPQVMQHPLDTAWQNVFTYASWGIVAIMLVIALRKGRAERTPFYVLAIAAAGLAAFAEPLYDVAFDLWFYDAHANGSAGAAQSHFTAFGVVQPNWTHSGYIILYSMACLYAGRRIFDGRMTRANLFQIWLLEIVLSCVFEVIGTRVNVYTYYGPYELRIWNYPLVIGVVEGTQVMLFTVLAVQLWRRVRTGWGLASVLAAFPVTMFGANFGLGAPVIIALHLDRGTFSSTLVWFATFLSIGLCAVAVRGASLFLPPRPVVGEQAAEPLPAATRTPVAA